MAVERGLLPVEDTALAERVVHPVNDIQGDHGHTFPPKNLETLLLERD